MATDTASTRCTTESAACRRATVIAVRTSGASSLTSIDSRYPSTGRAADCAVSSDRKAGSCTVCRAGDDSLLTGAADVWRVPGPDLPSDLEWLHFSGQAYVSCNCSGASRRGVLILASGWAGWGVGCRVGPGNDRDLRAN